MRKNAKKAAKTGNSASTTEGIHPSHEIRSSDASTFDVICTKCHRTDKVPGGLGELVLPCPEETMKDWIISGHLFYVLIDTRFKGAKKEKTGSEKQTQRFEAPTIDKARIKAKKILAQFEKDVRKKYKSNPRYQLESVTLLHHTFSEVHKL